VTRTEQNKEIQFSLTRADIESAVQDFVCRCHPEDAQHKVADVRLNGLDKTWIFPASVTLKTLKPDPIQKRKEKVKQ
jgi:hypothetical protein